MFLGVLAAVGGAWIFYEASQALSEVARLRDLPVIGWLVGGITEVVEAERIAQVKEIRSASLLAGLGGAGAVLLGLVLVATNPSTPSPPPQPAPTSSRGIGERRGSGLHEWSFDGPDSAHHLVRLEIGKYGGLGAISVDGEIVPFEKHGGILNDSVAFVVDEQLATLRVSASVSHTVVAKLFIGGRQIE